MVKRLKLPLFQEEIVKFGKLALLKRGHLGIFKCLAYLGCSAAKKPQYYLFRLQKLGYDKIYYLEFNNFIKVGNNLHNL